MKLLDLDKISNDRKQTLIDILNNYAREVDRYEYGLPNFDGGYTSMVKIITDWLRDIYLDYGENNKSEDTSISRRI